MDAEQKKEVESKTVALVVRVGDPPAVESVSTSLESLQALVGGYVEYLSLGDGLALWCNEEARLSGKELNSLVKGRSYRSASSKDQVVGTHFIFGDYLITREPDYYERIPSMTGDDLEKAVSRIMARSAD